MDPVSKSFSQNNGENRDKRLDNLRPFQPGQSGNPGGRPKKQYITKIYDKILRKAKNRKDIEKAIFETLTSGKMAAVLLLREAAERTEGRVVQPVEVNSTIHNISDEELDAKLAKLFGVTESSEDRDAANSGREATQSITPEDSLVLSGDRAATS